jgi:transposase
VLPRTHRTSLEKLVDEQHFAGMKMLDDALRSLVAVYKALKDQIRGIDRQLQTCARQSSVCRLLMTVPGVGPLTALAFVSTVDDPKRFSRSRNVGAYFGLTPRRCQSGELDANGSISKCGDSLMRAYHTAHARAEMVCPQSLGHPTRQAHWYEKGQGRCRAQAGRDDALHVADW